MKIAPVADVLAKNLVMLGQAYAKAKDCKLASVSRLVHGDPPALDNLATGKGSISLRKYDEAMAEFARIWPDDVPWPAILLPKFQKARARG